MFLFCFGLVCLFFCLCTFSWFRLKTKRKEWLQHWKLYKEQWKCIHPICSPRRPFSVLVFNMKEILALQKVKPVFHCTAYMHSLNCKSGESQDFFPFPPLSVIWRIAEDVCIHLAYLQKKNCFPETLSHCFPKTLLFKLRQLSGEL